PPGLIGPSISENRVLWMLVRNEQSIVSGCMSPGSTIEMTAWLLVTAPGDKLTVQDLQRDTLASIDSSRKSDYIARLVHVPIDQKNSPTYIILAGGRFTTNSRKSSGLFSTPLNRYVAEGCFTTSE